LFPPDILEVDIADDFLGCCFYELFVIHGWFELKYPRDFSSVTEWVSFNDKAGSIGYYFDLLVSLSLS
jgi:hypothetical protein